MNKISRGLIAFFGFLVFCVGASAQYGPSGPAGGYNQISAPNAAAATAIAFTRTAIPPGAGSVSSLIAGSGHITVNCVNLGSGNCFGTSDGTPTGIPNTIPTYLTILGSTTTSGSSMNGVVVTGITGGTSSLSFTGNATGTGTATGGTFEGVGSMAQDPDFPHLAAATGACGLESFTCYWITCDAATNAAIEAGTYNGVHDPGWALTTSCTGAAGSPTNTISPDKTAEWVPGGNGGQSLILNIDPVHGTAYPLYLITAGTPFSVGAGDLPFNKTKAHVVMAYGPAGSAQQLIEFDPFTQIATKVFDWIAEGNFPVGAPITGGTGGGYECLPGVTDDSWCATTWGTSTESENTNRYASLVQLSTHCDLIWDVKFDAFYTNGACPGAGSVTQTITAGAGTNTITVASTTGITTGVNQGVYIHSPTAPQSQSPTSITGTTITFPNAVPADATTAQWGGYPNCPPVLNEAACSGLSTITFAAGSITGNGTTVTDTCPSPLTSCGGSLKAGYVVNLAGMTGAGASSFNGQSLTIATAVSGRPAKWTASSSINASATGGFYGVFNQPDQPCWRALAMVLDINACNGLHSANIGTDASGNIYGDFTPNSIGVVITEAGTTTATDAPLLNVSGHRDDCDGQVIGFSSGKTGYEHAILFTNPGASAYVFQVLRLGSGVHTDDQHNSCDSLTQSGVGWVISESYQAGIATVSTITGTDGIHATVNCSTSAASECFVNPIVPGVTAVNFASVQTVTGGSFNGTATISSYTPGSQTFQIATTVIGTGKSGSAFLFNCYNPIPAGANELDAYPPNGAAGPIFRFHRSANDQCADNRNFVHQTNATISEDGLLAQTQSDDNGYWGTAVTSFERSVSYNVELLANVQPPFTVPAQPAFGDLIFDPPSRRSLIIAEAASSSAF
jgi:hypothetical protein